MKRPCFRAPKKSRFYLFLIIELALFSITEPAIGASPGQDRTASAYAQCLREVFQLRERIKSIHPLLENLHPVAIAEGENLLIFKPDETRKVYGLALRTPAPMTIPNGIRAAFPLEALGNKPACVVTGEVFDSREGYVLIFHEFVHCHQFLTCEPILKERLLVYRRAIEKKDFMWELQHPFPYTDPAFDRIYRRLLKGLDSGDEAAVLETRRELRRILPEEDYEYMVWQEWKEGLARFLENRIRVRLGLAKNLGGRRGEFSRVSFYAAGDRMIRFLADRDMNIPSDIEKTFEAIYSLK
ncbi:MAG TPA: hypothetical protein DIW61_06965 [Candidatus Aminicenantes bacterium]|nr:hypothetical protein [Candidatus Aminicenantes bacterium]